MRTVFDTVIFVRALINPRGRPGHLIFELKDRYVLFVSPEIIAEYIDVLHRSTFRRRFPQVDDVAVDRALAIIEEAEVVEPRERLEVCRDPNDNKFFECAVAARADYIVSEDRDILDAGDYRGIRTVSAGEFVELLAAR